MKNDLAALAVWLLGPEKPETHAPKPQGLGSELWSSEPAPQMGEPRPAGSTHLFARWIVLRGLALIYFSAFYSLLFQAKGLIGPTGILPARDYLQAVAGALHGLRFWFAPSLFWCASSDRALMFVCWIGIVASVLAICNIWPRTMFLICFVCFLSFIVTLQDFSSYQSDGMLLEAGFITLFFAPPGFWPGLGRANAPSRASLFLLRWEWFRIYFESGVAKIASGDPSWRHFTAMDNYYQNGPLPTWIGWYAQQLPHWFHASTAFFTLAAELVIAWMLFLPRRFRIICFCILTPFQIGIILTANYTFLNYLVLLLGFLLLDDRVIERIVPTRLRRYIQMPSQSIGMHLAPVLAAGRNGRNVRSHRWLSVAGMAIAGLCLGLVFYSTSLQLVWMFIPGFPLPSAPVQWLEPSRIANRYGLFAVMTPARYEIEFQGSRDGKTWTAYPFRYKPQDISKAPGIYAPYQPRFDWNLWFASLGAWQDYKFVVWTEERLLNNDSDVLHLFAGNPFGGSPPQDVRTVIYQYWFTNIRIKRKTGMWWRREMLGEYAPGLERDANGKIVLQDFPSARSQQP